MNEPVWTIDDDPLDDYVAMTLLTSSDVVDSVLGLLRSQGEAFDRLGDLPRMDLMHMLVLLAGVFRAAVGVESACRFIEMNRHNEPLDVSLAATYDLLVENGIPVAERL